MHPAAQHPRGRCDPGACGSERREPHRPAGDHRHRDDRAADRSRSRGGGPNSATVHQGADHRHAGARMAVRQHGLRAALRPSRLRPPEHRVHGVRVPANDAPGLLGFRLFLVHLRNGVRDIGRGDHGNAHPQDGGSTASRRSRSTSECLPSPSICWRRAARQRRRSPAERRSCAEQQPGNRRR